METQKNLKLITEQKLYKLIRNQNKDSRLEASGIYYKNNCFYVVFDNLTQVARLKSVISPKPIGNKLIHLVGEMIGFECISYSTKKDRFYLLIESFKHRESFNSIVQEYDENFGFIEQNWINFTLPSENKGFEGIISINQNEHEYLLALLEGNKIKIDKKGHKKAYGRIKVLTKISNVWEPIATIKLPKSLGFGDYAGMALRDDDILAVVSQESSKLWVGKLNRKIWKVSKGTVYKFPREKGIKVYGNIEGINWFSKNSIVVVSDKRKKKQNQLCEEKDQSIHIFEIPKI